MKILLGVLTWGLALAIAESQLSQIIHGGEFDLGPYDALVKIGRIPPRYPQLTDQDQKASYSLRRLLELMRGSFPTGIYLLPSLDPYIADNLSPITFNVPFLSGKVDLDQAVVTGLSVSQFDLIEVRFENLRTDFVVKVPLLTGIVSFRANLALGGLFPISVDGKLRVNIHNVKVNGAVGANEHKTPRHFYSLDTLSARFHADSVKISIDGLHLDRDILESLQASNLFGSSTALDPAKNVINYYVAEEILKQMDNILRNFSADQVKAYLLAR